MENDKMKDMDNSINLSFGKMIQNRRIKLKKSMKDVEKDLTKKEKVIQDGKEVEIEKAQITASYLNRIENDNGFIIHHHFKWIDLSKLNECNLLPSSIKENILNDKDIFHYVIKEN